jgi:ABC-type oligopeptide transport system substrate-binding subunit
MKMHVSITTPAAAAALLALAACVPTATQADAGTAPPPVADGEGPCRNDPVAGFVGRKATAELGAELLKVSGARTLRWGAPGTAMTMDFRPDRLTVSYDETMAITSARCG